MENIFKQTHLTKKNPKLMFVFHLNTPLMLVVYPLQRHHVPVSNEKKQKRGMP